MRIAIVTDSTCDLPPEIVAARHILIAPQHIIWGTENYTDGVDMKNDQFYRRLAQDRVMPKTSQPSPGEFLEKFREAVATQQADAIVCITISSVFSGTYNSALAARSMIDIPVHILDSRTGSLALGFVVLAAADARDRGASLDEILIAARQALQNNQLFFTLNTLEFLHRGGRIGGARRLIGAALNIKPILYVQNGGVEALDSVRTRKRALVRLVELTAQYQDKRPLWVGIIHTTAPDLDEFTETIQEIIHPDRLLQSMACSAVGTHAGPGAIGVGIVYGSDQGSL